MNGEPLWESVDLRDDGLVLRVMQPTDTRALALALVGSQATARRVLARGQLRSNGAVLRHDERLAAGSLVELPFHRADAQASQDPSLPDAVRVVYQDPVLLAVDKPVGLLVHGDGTGADTLAARVRAHLAREGRPPVAQAVQRLDVETTGLVLFSLTEEFQPALDAQVAGHDMRKRYLAVTRGRLPVAPGEWLHVDEPIARDRHDARRMRVARSGKPARTQVRELRCEQGLSLLLVELLTGRRHQIRVHLAHMGCPLLGDGLYGGPRHDGGLMLHAWEERLMHPVTGERLHLRTDVPDRFVRLFGEEPFA